MCIPTMGLMSPLWGDTEGVPSLDRGVVRLLGDKISGNDDKPRRNDAPRAEAARRAIRYGG